MKLSTAYGSESVYMITARAIGFALYWPCDPDHPVMTRLRGCSAFRQRAELISMQWQVLISCFKGRLPPNPSI